MRRTLAAALTIAGLAAMPVFAANVVVFADIGVSTTWTASNTYELVGNIHVLPGATLTIEPGTVVACPPANVGRLVVDRGADIIAVGTRSRPIVMTSTLDVATWSGGDPSTGAWREAAGEWCGLALFGTAYVASPEPGNSPIPSAANRGLLDGLIPLFGGDIRPYYGGDIDDDDSGTLAYVSIRYAGTRPCVNPETDGLALAGVGRDTDVHHVEVLNSVDDGIGLW